MARYALLSVSDKRGLVEFATGLVKRHGFTLLSTGGTARLLSDLVAGRPPSIDPAPYAASRFG